MNRITAFFGNARKNVIALVMAVVLMVLGVVVGVLDRLAYGTHRFANRVALTGLRWSDWAIHTLGISPACNAIKAAQQANLGATLDATAPVQAPNAPQPGQRQIIVSQPTKFVS